MMRAYTQVGENLRAPQDGIRFILQVIPDLRKPIDADNISFLIELAYVK